MTYRAVMVDLFGTLAGFSARAHDRVLVAMTAALGTHRRSSGTCETRYIWARSRKQEWNAVTIQLLSEIPTLLSPTV
jgi:hypothetical protein